MSSPSSTKPKTETALLSLDKAIPVHFIGVGGIGMSGLAKLLLETGFMVSGSDIAANKQTALLQSLGGKIYKGHAESQVPDNAILIISSSIDTQNPEIRKALDNKQAIFHRSDLLRAILQDKLFAHRQVVGISGTHGKTTITGMCGLALEKAGLSPTVVVGGNVPQWQSNAVLGGLDKTGARQVAVAELDESDGTIVKYTPQITVISNLELDHADHYHDGLAAIHQTFTDYLNALCDGSTVIFSLDCPETVKLAKSAPQHLNKVFYTGKDLSANPAEAQSVFDALGASELFWLKNTRHHGFGAYQGYAYRQTKQSPGKLLGEIHLSVPGHHNLINALSVIAVSQALEADFDDVTEALREFSGMGRRFEKVGTLKIGGGLAKLVDDYGHHPTEVSVTLQAAKDAVKANDGQVIVVFQPHRYTRLKALWDDFCTCFEAADHVVITDVYAASEQPIPGVNAEDFAKAAKHPNVRYQPLEPGQFTQIRNHVKTLAKPGDIILSMGAGNITQAFRGWEE